MSQLFPICFLILSVSPCLHRSVVPLSWFQSCYCTTHSPPSHANTPVDQAIDCSWVSPRLLLWALSILSDLKFLRAQQRMRDWLVQWPLQPICALVSPPELLRPLCFPLCLLSPPSNQTPLNAPADQFKRASFHLLLTQAALFSLL